MDPEYFGYEIILLQSYALALYMVVSGVMLFMWLEIMMNLFQIWVILDSCFNGIRQNDRYV